MPSNLNLDYYYGSEGDQYSFYRIPKTLLTDPRYKGVSLEAKVLYGLLLDRMGLSVKNGWTDSGGRVYLYFTQEDAMGMLNCGHNKAVKLFAELDQTGLIERKKQGQGRPTRIYVKNFVLPPLPDPEPETEPPQSPKDGQTSALRKPHPAPEVQTSETGKPAHPETGGLDFPGEDANKTEKNDTDWNETDPSILPPTLAVTSSASLASPQAAKLTHCAAPALPTANASLVCGGDPGRPKGRIRMDEMDRYRMLIKENIGFDQLLAEHPYDGETLEGYVELMVEVCCSRKDFVRIAGEEMAAEVVKSRFLKLSHEHIAYVLESMNRNTALVRNIKAYTLAALYNAPVTISQYYASQASHDLAWYAAGQ
ncbi:replication initiator A domain-containing protein [Pseudoflavonifractor sp. 524-17]|nr:DUF6017 domain-containing protein [Pseudoflavonifractor sp. 524-17]NCE65660.1 replication initiator A domain-containing protein [Pseudoflavonifractor sp. 524-17]